MGTMVGTVITVKELYGVKSADIQFRNGTNSTPLITLEENRKYIVPYFQREIRWTKDNLITLINDVRKGSKFLGNLIFTKRQSDYEILDGQQRTTVIAVTALVTGVINYVFFWNTALCGASGVVFAFILMASFTSFREGEIPITFILVAAIYLGQQIYDGVVLDDNISNMAHVVGGIVGGILGFSLNKKSKYGI